MSFEKNKNTITKIGILTAGTIATISGVFALTQPHDSQPKNAKAAETEQKAAQPSKESNFNLERMQTVPIKNFPEFLSQLGITNPEFSSFTRKPLTEAGCTIEKAMEYYTKIKYPGHNYTFNQEGKDNFSLEIRTSLTNNLVTKINFVFDPTTGHLELAPLQDAQQSITTAPDVTNSDLNARTN